ncbi:hypothetical protein L581_4330 [Serratia fonticola AU-AP2C]|nr:hypothetical protein L581_4330 [Serratia fonticola AU-AP2C]
MAGAIETISQIHSIYALALLVSEMGIFSLAYKENACLYR